MKRRANFGLPREVAIVVLMTSYLTIATTASLLPLVMEDTGVEAAEQQGCAEPQPLQHGVLQLESDMSSVDYICKPGYSLVGSPTASCNNGHWSTEPPLCVGSDCPLVRVRHATIMSSCHGGMVKVKCRRGYRLTGPELLACVDGQWNSTETPFCVGGSKTKYKKSNDVDGAFDSASSTASAAASDGASDADKMSHEQRLEQADYTCIRSEEGAASVAPPRVRNARYFTQWAVQGGRPRLYATYQCNWGYVIASGFKGTARVYCRSGEWVGTTPSCVYFVGSDNDDNLQSDVGGSVGPPPSHDDLLRQADYSCIGPTAGDNVDPPSPEHSIVALKFIIIGGKPHLYARYTCEEGYGQLRDQTAARGGHMYCKRKAWIGLVPTCVEAAQFTDQCLTNNGGCHQLCTSQFGRISCSCKHGFMLADDQQTCLDVDECEVNHGDCQHLCDNVEGRFTCSCYDGYQLNDDQTSCSSIDDRK